ncbi:TraR/DksA C4-type zinc finger protein [Alkalicoccus luteus]|uniref:Molecular chaperone DnaK n=1 Tax=Alkalicoccus luteus TaxID=1237094 RepID=A0A969TUU2_9BACI|nr:TraR/DksA C4-type zinc finger protein [Alkalicoccus luteus]NJP37326.1 molecular chaperone DnaK [Alkalicoccus luteus]
MNEKKLSYFKDKLLKRREEILNNSSESEESEELSNYDNHPADQGTELAERHTDAALEQQQRDEMAEIDESLNMIENGTYGTCIVSGEQIPEERLEIMPHAKTTVEHAEQRDSRNRPVEEEVTDPLHDSSARGSLRSEFAEEAYDHGSSDSDQDK